MAAEKQVAAAHAQLEVAEATDVKVQSDVRRYKLLLDKQEVAEQLYEQAVSAAPDALLRIPERLDKRCLPLDGSHERSGEPFLPERKQGPYRAISQGLQYE